MEVFGVDQATTEKIMALLGKKHQYQGMTLLVELGSKK
jgi:ABC-type phosphate/phosphonate transport system ATPase subunit